jgi:hypothetical protein
MRIQDISCKLGIQSGWLAAKVGTLGNNTEGINEEGERRDCSWNEGSGVFVATYCTENYNIQILALA